MEPPSEPGKTERLKLFVSADKTLGFSSILFIFIETAFVIRLVNICHCLCAYRRKREVFRQERPNLFSMFPSGPVGAFEWQINRAVRRLRLHQED